MLLNLHQDASQLYPFVEVLKYLLLYSFYFLRLFDSTAVTDLSLFPDVVVPCMNGHNLRFNFTAAAFVLQLKFELFYFLPEVVDDVFVLTDMDGNQLLVSYGLCLYVLCSIHPSLFTY